ISAAARTARPPFRPPRSRASADPEPTANPPAGRSVQGCAGQDVHDRYRRGAMKPSRAFRPSSRVASVAALLLLAPVARADTEVSVPAFKSVDSRNGAHVTLRHGDK